MTEATGQRSTERVCIVSEQSELALNAFLHRAVSSTELPALQSTCEAIIKEQQPFERLEVSKEVLLDMFKVISCQECEK